MVAFNINWLSGRLLTIVYKTSLEEAKISQYLTYWLHIFRSMKDYGRLKNRVSALQVEMPRYDKLREIRWKKVLRSVGKTGSGFGEYMY